MKCRDDSLGWIVSQRMSFVTNTYRQNYVEERLCKKGQQGDVEYIVLPTIAIH